MDRCIAIVEAKRCSISETDTQLFYFATARGYYTQYVRQLMTGWRVEEIRAPVNGLGGERALSW